MKPISDEDLFEQGPIALRLVRLSDCTPQYLSWLSDADVTRYLETRWVKQTIETITEFVSAERERDDSYLMAILERKSVRHLGNIKIGPIQPNHRYADISFFIGEKSTWGLGYATEAIRLATAIAFSTLGVERLDAGVYQHNVGSARALEKVGYKFEGRQVGKLVSGTGRQDRLCFGLCRDEYDAPEYPRTPNGVVGDTP